jgi:hypothetical protein
MMTPMSKTFNWESPPLNPAGDGQAESSGRDLPAGNPAQNGTHPQRTKRMWKVVITEIQDANALDPINAPPGAFFVYTERFARTVDCLDLPNIISVINRTESSSRGYRRENIVPSEGIPGRQANLVEVGYPA